MSFDNKLHAALLIAFVALLSAVLVTVAPNEGAQAAALAKAKTTQLASTSVAPCPAH